MTSRPFAAFLLLASAGVACLVYAGADFIAHEWAVKNLWPLLAAGFAVVPIVAFVAWGRRWWEREGAKINHDRALTWALDTETARKEAELAQQAAAGGSEEATPPKTTAVMVWRFFRAADALGFALDGLTAAGVVTQPTWQRVKDFYLQWPADGPVLVDRGGNIGTVWAPTWTLGRVGDEIALGTLPLPPGAPPDVGVYVPSQHNTQQSTKRNKRGAAGMTVDSVAREVGQ